MPHFHHELVYEAVTMAIERSDRRSTDEMVRLLKTMYGACVLTTNQMDEVSRLSGVRRGKVSSAGVQTGRGRDLGAGRDKVECGVG